MKAVLVLLALEIVPPQLGDLPVVPPQKPADDNIEDPDDDDGGPVRLPENVGRADLLKPWGIL